MDESGYQALFDDFLDLDYPLAAGNFDFDFDENDVTYSERFQPPTTDTPQTLEGVQELLSALQAKITVLEVKVGFLGDPRNLLERMEKVEMEVQGSKNEWQKYKAGITEEMTRLQKYAIAFVEWWDKVAKHITGLVTWDDPEKIMPNYTAN